MMQAPMDRKETFEETWHLKKKIVLNHKKIGIAGMYSLFLSSNKRKYRPYRSTRF